MMFLPNTKARPCDVPTAITFETVCKHKRISDVKKTKKERLIRKHKKVKYSLSPLASQHQLYPEERWKEYKHRNRVMRAKQFHGHRGNLSWKSL